MDIKTKYGINTNEKLSPLMVRDAMVKCFYEAHCMDSAIDSEDQDNKINKEYCKSIIKKAFDDVGQDFDNPNKDSLRSVVDNLKEFSLSFRDQSIIEEHAREIQSLINELD